MHEEFSKPVKKKLKELILEAHKNALPEPLAQLGHQFERWRNDEIDVFELAELIHKFDNGPNREIFKRFTWSSYDDLTMRIAAAINDGLLDEKAVPEEVMATSVGRWLAIIREHELRTRS